MISRLVILPCLLALALSGCRGDQLPELTEPPVKIASFNIQVFGLTKMSKPAVVDILLRTLHRYDLIFIQEIRDKSGEAIKDLLRRLNSQIGQSSRQFDLLISERLGRTSSKEQYAYLYRRSNFRLLDTYQYKDPQDVFERPPFGAKFEVKGAEQLTVIGFLGIHAAPNDAFDELQGLHSVQKLARQRWRTDNVLVMGDFNADCTYLRRSERFQLQLWQDRSIDWLIDACHETTAVRTSCLYDRILANGQQLKDALLRDTAGVFYFDEAFNLNRTMAEQVSDHYPVEVQLAGKFTDEGIRRLVTRQSIEVSQLAMSSSAALSLCRSGKLAGFALTCLRANGSAKPHSAVARRASVTDVAGALQQLRASVPNLLQAYTVSLTERLRRHRLPQADRTTVEVTCSLARTPYQCGVRITADDESVTAAVDAA